MHLLYSGTGITNNVARRFSESRDVYNNMSKIGQVKRDFFKEYIFNLCDTVIRSDRKDFDKIVETLIELKKKNKCLYVCGNGGSASTASHTQNDFVKAGGMRAISLTDISLLTAYSNDDSYEKCFANMLNKMMLTGDVLLCMSVSGTSPNIVEAARFCKDRGNKVIALTGRLKNNGIRLSDMGIAIDSTDYKLVEDAHLMICHRLVAALEYKKGVKK